MLIVVILLVLLLLGGSGYGYQAGWQGPQYGGLLGLVLVILLILALTGNLNPGTLRIR
jgi:hypothetical protein